MAEKKKSRKRLQPTATVVPPVQQSTVPRTDDGAFGTNRAVRITRSAALSLGILDELGMFQNMSKRQQAAISTARIILDSILLGPRQSGSRGGGLSSL